MADQVEPGAPSDDRGELRRAAETILARLSSIEHGIERAGDEVARDAEHIVVPAWRRVTEGEPRWPVSIAIVTAIALQLLLPAELTFGGRWLLPILEAILLVGLLAANPLHPTKRTPALRALSIALIAVISLANGYSAVRLVRTIVQGTGTADPAILLGSGAAVWVTNVIVFALWYWDLDRGGPAARAAAVKGYPDFLFGQMTAPELVQPDWEPTFVDYFYLSFTNATAFSPTDVLPMARWAKLTMAGQAAISLVTVGLVVARAVNILK